MTQPLINRYEHVSLGCADLARMYLLVSRVPTGLAELRNYLNEHIHNQGSLAIDKCGEQCANVRPLAHCLASLSLPFAFPAHTRNHCPLLPLHSAVPLIEQPSPSTLPCPSPHLLVPHFSSLSPRARLQAAAAAARRASSARTILVRPALPPRVVILARSHSSFLIPRDCSAYIMYN